MKFTAAALFFIKIFLITPCQLHAQYYTYHDKYYDQAIVCQAGISAGGMSCLTDLGGGKGTGKNFIKDYNFNNTQFCGGVYFNAMYNDAFGLRIEGTYGRVQAYDSILKKAGNSTYGRYERNLSFRSSILELMAAIEIHPLYFFGSTRNDWEPPLLSPYVLAGVGVFKFNPKAKLDKSWVELQPLHTEGEGFSKYPDRKEYKLTQINFPVGAGLKYQVSSVLNIKAEFVYRILRTDYLDDVSTTYIDPMEFQNYLKGTRLTQALLLNKRSTNTSVYRTDPGSQRGNPNVKDSYFSFNLKIGLVFSTIPIHFLNL